MTTYRVVPQRIGRKVIWLCRTRQGVTTHPTKAKALAFGESLRPNHLEIVR